MRITELVLNLNFDHEQLIDCQNAPSSIDESIYNNKQYLIYPHKRKSVRKN